MATFEPRRSQANQGVLEIHGECKATVGQDHEDGKLQAGSSGS